MNNDLIITNSCQLVEQKFQFMKKGKMIEVVYCSTVEGSPYL